MTGQRQKELPRPPGPSLSLVRARLGAGEAPSQRQRHLNVWVVIYGTKTQPPEVRVTQCLSRCALHAGCSEAVSASSGRWEREGAEEEKQLDSLTLKIHIV